MTDLWSAGVAGPGGVGVAVVWGCGVLGVWAFGSGLGVLCCERGLGLGPRSGLGRRILGGGEGGLGADV